MKMLRERAPKPWSTFSWGCFYDFPTDTWHWVISRRVGQDSHGIGFSAGAEESRGDIARGVREKRRKLAEFIRQRAT